MFNREALRATPPPKNIDGSNGFTLAEVLITLGIIGVIAALTIPALINDYKAKETVTKLKKFYSTMSQAYISIINDYGPMGVWGQTNSQQDATALAASYFKKYLNINKDCGFEKGCFENQDYYTYSTGVAIVNFITHRNRYMFRLNDGSAIAFYTQDKNFSENSTIVIYYDINGDKKPNVFGKDLFQIVVFNDRVKFGGSTTTRQEILNNCLTSGYDCANWVLLYENMDYIKCPDYLKSDSSAVSCK